MDLFLRILNPYYNDYMEMVAKDDLSGGTYYSRVERYVIQQLCRPQRLLVGGSVFEMTLHYCDQNGIQEYRKKIKINRCVQEMHFKAKGAPEYPFERSQNKHLYHPECKSYPGVDILLYLPDGDMGTPMLWAVRVTGKRQPDQHMNEDDMFFPPEKVKVRQSGRKRRKLSSSKLS